MSDKTKGELSAEESAFRNEAFTTIRALAHENKRLTDLSVLGRRRENQQKTSSSTRIAGLKTLNPRMGKLGYPFGDVDRNEQ